MTITPAEIRHVKLKRRLLGYQRGATNRLLSEVADSFEDLWVDRADVGEQVERLEAQLGESHELETLLRNTLMSAERAAEDVRAQARRDAELIQEEARAKARTITFEAESERERIQAEIRRLRALETEMRARYRAFLLGALDRLEPGADEARASGQAA